MQADALCLLCAAPCPASHVRWSTCIPCWRCSGQWRQDSLWRCRSQSLWPCKLMPSGLSEQNMQSRQRRYASIIICHACSLILFRQTTFCHCEHKRTCTQVDRPVDTSSHLQAIGHRPGAAFTLHLVGRGGLQAAPSPPGRPQTQGSASRFLTDETASSSTPGENFKAGMQSATGSTQRSDTTGDMSTRPGGVQSTASGASASARQPPAYVSDTSLQPSSYSNSGAAPGFLGAGMNPPLMPVGEGAMGQQQQQQQQQQQHSSSSSNHISRACRKSFLKAWRCQMSSHHWHHQRCRKMHPLLRSSQSLMWQRQRAAGHTRGQRSCCGTFRAGGLQRTSFLQSRLRAVASGIFCTCRARRLRLSTPVMRSSI